LREIRSLWNSVRPDRDLHRRPHAASGGEIDHLAWFRAQLTSLQARLYRDELQRRLTRVERRIVARKDAADRQSSTQSVVAARQEVLAMLQRHQSQIEGEIGTARRLASRNEAD
jgi:hypothetical protein